MLGLVVLKVVTPTVVLRTLVLIGGYVAFNLLAKNGSDLGMGVRAKRRSSCDEGALEVQWFTRRLLHDHVLKCARDPARFASTYVASLGDASGPLGGYYDGLCGNFRRQGKL
jgi:hypothetical protein